MEDKEFILEALKRITLDTSWHGESYADNKSLDNIDILEDMICFLLDELFNCSTVPEGNKGNGSFRAIAKRKQKVINYIEEEYFEKLEERKKITLKEFWKSKEHLAIHCDTEEKANRLLKAFDKMGKKWIDGDSYLEINCWSEYKEHTCYDNDKDSGYSPVNFYNADNYTIYEFEDIDLGDE